MELSIGIDHFPQFTRTLEGYHPPFSEHHILARGWIPAFAGGFIFDTKFSKTGYQKILPGFQGFLDQLQEAFHMGLGILPGKYSG